MKRIQHEHFHEIEINKSQFICYLKRVTTDEEAKDYLKQIRKLHPKANHHCYAYYINETLQRSNDDGEPSGTAGIPMLEVLRKNELEFIMAIVVRYFGGILLGASGLVRAYSKAVSEAIAHTNLYEVQQINRYQVNFPYEFINKIEHLLKEEIIEEKIYEEIVSYQYLSNNESLPNSFSELTSGQHLPLLIECIQIEIPIKHI